MKIITIAGMIFLFLAILLTSCKTTEYIPIESVRVEYKDRHYRDSIYLYDSVFIKEKGDTVWLTRWRTEYKNRLIRDSIIICDSIQVPYPVERSLSRWEQFKMDTGGIAIGSLLIVVGVFIIWLIMWLRKQKNRM